MARCPNFAQIVLVMCLLAAPAHGATAGVNQSTTASASACPATSWIDVRCYGATGNGSTDDTAAINRALVRSARIPTSLCFFRMARSNSPARWSSTTEPDRTPAFG